MIFLYSRVPNNWGTANIGGMENFWKTDKRRIGIKGACGKMDGTENRKHRLLK